MSTTKMPTAGKLVACLGLAGLGYWIGLQAFGLLTEMSRMGYLPPLGAGIGAFVGWGVIGPDTVRRGARGTSSGASSGFGRGFASGLKGVVFFTILLLLSIGVVQMLRLAVRRRYDGPMEAVTDIVAQALKVGQLLMDPVLIASLCLGAGLVGVIAVWAGGKWQ